MSYSLEGEDKIVASLLRKASTGTYFDIGCSDPIEISNTFYFYKRGWRGLCVDGRTELATRWRDARPQDDFRSVLVGEFDEYVDYFRFPDATLNTCDSISAERYSKRYLSTETIVEKRQVRRGKDLWFDWIHQKCSTSAGSTIAPPTFLSIDVEGFEMPILRGLLDFNLRPPLIVCETKLFNFRRPMTQPLVEYLTETQHYCLIAKTPLDAFFIDPNNELFDWIPKEMTSVI